MLRDIWVVSGQCGEYSDRCEWTVRAFLTEAAANAYREKLVQAMRDGGAVEQPYDEDGGGGGGLLPYPRFSEEGDAFRKKMRELDDGFYTDYTGTSYTVYRVDLEEVP